MNLENGPDPIASCGIVMALIVVLFDSAFFVTQSLLSFHYDLFFPSSLLYSGVDLVGTSSPFVSPSLSVQKSFGKVNILSHQTFLVSRNKLLAWPGSLNFIQLLRVIYSSQQRVTEGVITTRSNRMKFRLMARPIATKSSLSGYLNEV